MTSQMITIMQARERSDSMLTLPQLPRRALLVLNVAMRQMDAYGYVDEHGDPPSAMTTLMHSCQMNRGNVWQGLRRLEERDLATRIYADEPSRRSRRRYRHGQPLRVRIHIERLRLTNACGQCGKPADYRDRWCGRCFQLFGRDDRAWMFRARDYFGRGKTPSEIAVLVSRPMYEARNDDGRDGSGGNAVVPWLINDPELADWPEREEWVRRLNEWKKGRGIDE